MVKVRMNTCLGGVNYTHHVGSEPMVDETEAARLIAKGYASLVNPDDQSRLPVVDITPGPVVPLPMSAAAPKGDDEEDDSDALTIPVNPSSTGPEASAAPAEATEEAPKPTALQKAKATQAKTEKKATAAKPKA